MKKQQKRTKKLTLKKKQISKIENPETIKGGKPWLGTVSTGLACIDGNPGKTFTEKPTN